MVECHPNISNESVELSLENVFSEFDMPGFISMKILRLFFNVFSWYYMEGHIKHLKIGEPFDKLFKGINLKDFKEDSIAYSAVLLYCRASKKFNMRKLDIGDLDGSEVGDNKKYAKEDFSNKKLFDLYKDTHTDLSDDFLLFNKLFIQNTDKESNNIKDYSDIVRSTNLYSLVLPNLPYKLATKTLMVSKDAQVDAEQRVLYILQDCTLSMKKYIKEIYMLKGFILNEAFKHNYRVEWLFTSDEVVDRAVYSKTKTEDLEHLVFKGYKMNVSKILTSDEFLNKQVLIITDGTDNFDFDFTTKTKKINFISFTDNIILKNKVSAYGRFFRLQKRY